MVLSSRQNKSLNPKNFKSVRVLITAQPLVNLREEFEALTKIYDFEVTWKQSPQAVAEVELFNMIGKFDGWILGDDPCTRKVLKAGKLGNLKAIVKWGIGVDNIDLKAVEDMSLGFSNTPNVFGNEVADLAMANLINLSRHTIEIHSAVKSGYWIKPVGQSLAGMKVALVGFGDIGQQIYRRLEVVGAEIFIYEIDQEKFKGFKNLNVRLWPDDLNDMDAIIFACSLNEHNYKMLDRQTIERTKQGILIVNISRGGLISQNDLEESLANGHIGGAALDVYDIEPLPHTSPLRQYKNVILGTHNASNTRQAVIRASRMAFLKLHSLMREKLME